jgi:hypothetical protein
MVNAYDDYVPSPEIVKEVKHRLFRNRDLRNTFDTIGKKPYKFVSANPNLNTLIQDIETVKEKSKLHPKEIFALNFIMNELPHSRLKNLFLFMIKEKINLVSKALIEFSKFDKIQKEISQMKTLLTMRKAVKSTFKPTISNSDIVITPCVSDYMKIAWMSDFNYKGVALNQNEWPNINLDENVVDNWFKAPLSWIRDVCVNGRDYVSNGVAYIIDDDDKKVGNRRLAVETFENFLKSEHFQKTDAGMQMCINQFKTAPWTKRFGFSSNEIVMRQSVANDTGNSRFLTNSVVFDDWFSIDNSWFKQICLNQQLGLDSRKFVEGLIGYVVVIDKREVKFNKQVIKPLIAVTPETKQLFDASNQFVNKLQPDDVQPQYDQKFLSAYENAVRRVSWVVGHVSKRIKTIVARKTKRTNNWIVNEPVKSILNQGEWYLLKSSWYKHICQKGRTFEPDVFGYQTLDNKVIPETLELFQKFEAFMRHLKNLDDDEPDRISKELAVQFLTQHNMSSILASQIVDVIITNNPSVTNRDMMKVIARLAAFGTPFLKKRKGYPNLPSQVHIQRLKHEQFSAENLLSLSDADMLPEMLLDDNASSSNLKSFLKLLTRTKFNRLSSSLKSGVLKPSPHQNVQKFQPFSENFLNAATSRDVVYYLEKATLYCFDRKIIKNFNPSTGQPLSEDFKNKVAKIENPVDNSDDDDNDDDNPKMVQNLSTVKEEEEQKIPKMSFFANQLKKQFERLGKPFLVGYQFCSNCKINKKTLLKTPHAGKEKGFCSINCFEKHRFNKKMKSYGKN